MTDVRSDEATFSVFCPGVLEVLSIGKGDLRLTVGGDNPEDTERAKRLIEEMLRKGYAIFVETDSGPERVTRFNPRRMTYLVAGEPEIPEPEVTPSEAGAASLDCWCGRPKRHSGAHKGQRPKRREVPVAGSRATAVGRTAGG